MKPSLIWILLGVVGLLIIGFLASRVGGIAIRRAAQQGDGVTMSISSPAIPGVPTVVRWQALAGIANSPIVLKERSASGERIIGQGLLGDESAAVVFPCDDSGRVSLLLEEERTAQVLASLPVEVLTAGPDCVH